LGVRTGRFSLLPRKLPNHRLQLGYVETARSDVLREAIIGGAPLILGGLVITWIGVSIFGMADLGILLRQAQWDLLFQRIIQLPSTPDFWLWFYLCFTVSSTMLPSPSDRQAWIPLAGILVLLVGAAFIAGVGPWLSTNLAPFFGNIISVLSLVFVLGLFIHAILLIPVWLFRVLLQNLIPL
jgi:hypothetical protein